MNVSGTLNAFRLLFNPAICLPHHTISTFDQLPIPLSKAFLSRNASDKRPDIRAVILDKDNCFAVPHENHVYKPYEQHFEELKKAYPGSRLLIVSNSAGTNSDPGFKDAELLEQNTGMKVLRHSTKKPGCHGEIMSYLRNSPDTGVTGAHQVAIVGDRLFTDVMMANMMGAHGVWVRDGVVPDHGLVRCLLRNAWPVWQRSKMLILEQASRFEKGLHDFLTRRGYAAPETKSEFE